MKMLNPAHLFFISALFLFSCKTLEKPSMPVSSALPSRFAGDSSKTGIGEFSIKSYFNDSILVSLIETAIHNNPDVLIASQRIEMTRANFLLSKGAYLPFFSADALGGAAKYGKYTMNGVGNYDSNLSPNVKGNLHIPTKPTPDYLLGLNSSWEIDVWGRLRNKKRAAYARLLASAKGRHLIITSLVASVSELYFTLLTLDREMQIVRDNIKLREKIVETISFLKDGGKTNELALKQSTAQLMDTKALEYIVLQDITSTENKLNFLLGRFPQPIVREKELKDDFFPVQIKSGVPSDMLLRRPDIQQAELELHASEYEIKSARAAFLPSLNISALGGYNSFNATLLTNPGSMAWAMLGSLSAPLFQGNRIRANYKNSIASNYEAYYHYQKTIYHGFMEVHTNLMQIENYRKVVNLKKQEVDTWREAITSSGHLFSVGYANYLEVITAQKNALEAEIGLINAQKEQYFALINLYRSLGGGWK